MPGIIVLPPETPPLEIAPATAGPGTLGALIEEIHKHVKDPRLRESFAEWINEAVYDIATEFDLPYLKAIEPYPLTVTDDKWLYDVPESYHKRLFRCENNTRLPIEIARTLDYIEVTDSDHDETATNVELVGVCDIRRKIAVYRKANDTLYLWFYRNPEVLDAPTSVLSCIPRPYQTKVLLPKVILKNFEILEDLLEDFSPNPLLYWEGQYSKGLFGARAGDIGMLNYFLREKGVRRHGGRDPLP